MHFCTARIAIAGDHQNVYSATEFDPISWPEIAVLQYLHGDQSITEVVPFAVAAQTGREERSRLAEKYKESIVSEVFGGRQSPGELDAPQVRIKPGVTWMNPLTRTVEVTGNGRPVEPVVPVVPEEEPGPGPDPDPADEPPPRAAGGRFQPRK